MRTKLTAPVGHRASASIPGGFLWSDFPSLLPLTRCLSCRNQSLTMKLLGYGVLFLALTNPLRLRLQQPWRQQLLLQARRWKGHLRLQVEPQL